MFKRKLQALDYHSWDEFDPSDEKKFRNLVVWLEDQKIRHYKIEDRAGLRDIGNDLWQSHFSKYLEDIGGHMKSSHNNSLIDWLLGYAVRLEYGDNLDSFKGVSASTSSGPTKAASSNPLDNLDFDGPDFKAGVASLSSMLQIPPHQDHLVVLKAVCILAKERFNKETIERVKKEGIKPSKPMPLEQVPLGFETSDYITTEAAKILRLLHIKELRELQNVANEAIVAVQTITANPKTDTKLGKVGKG